jgi:hypothetical protein
MKTLARILVLAFLALGCAAVSAIGFHYYTPSWAAAWYSRRLIREALKTAASPEGQRIWAEGMKMSRADGETIEDLRAGVADGIYESLTEELSANCLAAADWGLVARMSVDVMARPELLDEKPSLDEWVEICMLGPTEDMAEQVVDAMTRDNDDDDLYGED